jgi:uncharacterized protein
VKMDGRDPHLLANLQKIGQVKVPKGKVLFQQSNPMLNILAAREKNSSMEEEANSSAQLSSQGVSNAGAIKNRLNAQSIIALLDERKECKSRREVEELAIAYDMDIDILDRLARWINSPSIETGASVRQRPQPMNMNSDDDVSAGEPIVEATSYLTPFDFLFSAVSQMPDKINAVWTEPVLSDVREIRE